MQSLLRDPQLDSCSCLVLDACTMPCLCPLPSRFRCDFRGDFSAAPAGTQCLNSPSSSCIAVLLPLLCFGQEWLSCLDALQSWILLSLQKCPEGFVHLSLFILAEQSDPRLVGPHLMSPDPSGEWFWCSPGLLFGFLPVSINNTFGLCYLAVLFLCLCQGCIPEFELCST